MAGAVSGAASREHCMPKPALADRILAQLRNNPILAVVVALGVIVTGLANFSRSMTTLLDTGSRLAPGRTADIAGTWMSLEPDETTTVKTILVFQFTTRGTELTGTMHRGYPQALLNGRVERDTLAFDVDQHWDVGGKVRVEREAYRGTLAGHTIRFTRTADGAPPFEFRAVKKVPRPAPPALKAGGRLGTTRIVFSREHLWIMNADGSERRRLGAAGTGSATAPAWSPDGRRIAYERHDAEDRHAIHVIDVDTARERRLIARPGSWADPSWSPDGQRLVVADTGDDDPGIHVVAADGSASTRLTHGAHTSPSFSPDGTRIVYVDRRLDRIVVMNADGSGGRPLATGGHPAWSPDGTRIAYERTGAENSQQIVVMNADGTGAAALTADWARAADPGWSPDGSMIVFVSNHEGESDIFVMSADGSNPLNLTGELGDYARPAWSPPHAR
jgi:dipeptidyl aminopeptidase/acylaminoacyl peptidase